MVVAAEPVADRGVPLDREQQGVEMDDFDRCRDQRFWQGLAYSIPAWDRLIEEFNAEAGCAAELVRS